MPERRPLPLWAGRTAALPGILLAVALVAAVPVITLAGTAFVEDELAGADSGPGS
ncbi:hypothetical protein [Catenuloplanes japonicus]|uniref:hypothetical protein n=1 Tax=Catenuloplanes japonicus TaxID=33876 RepID=UPI000B310B63|nr:hypothetical protein [Catenuloplanes japonicus]